MLDNLMNQMKEQLEASKQKMAEMRFTVEKDGIAVTTDGNRNIMDLSISDELMTPDRKEELEDLLLVVLNEATEKAEAGASEAMKGLTDGLMPGGLGGLF